MITINMERARTIAHTHRRAEREKEFAPYDAVIMKQIPGNDMVAAEAARVAIRAKYATMQTNIDAATTVDGLKQAAGL